MTKPKNKKMEEIIKIGKNFILTKKGRWIYEERGLFIEDFIKQISSEPPKETIRYKREMSTGTDKININNFLT